MAQAALLLFPLFGVALFAALGPGRGTIWVTLLGYLILPSSFSIDLPGLPPFSKTEAVAVALLLGLAVSAPGRGAGRVGPAIWALTVLAAASFVLTWLFNTQPFVAGGGVVRPGLTIADARSDVIGFLAAATPLFVALRTLRYEEMLSDLARALMAACAVYAFLGLFEMRMSPLLHYWTYGFFPHQWAQHVRGDGFRPVVYLPHGLEYGLLLLIGLLVAAGRVRAGGREGLFAVFAVVLFGGVLLLTRNLGALMLAVLFAPLMFFSTVKMQVRVAATVAVAVLFYPVLRGLDLVPYGSVLDLAANIDAERAASFLTRLENEDLFLDIVAQQPVFGWGGWARARPLSNEGLEYIVADGAWIIKLAQYGWYGYLTFFGLLVVPLLALWRALSRGAAVPLAAAAALAVAVSLVNLIPNSTWSPLQWLLMGVVMTAARQAGRETTGAVDRGGIEAEPRRRGTPAFTRFPDEPPEPVARSGTSRPVPVARIQPSGMKRGRGPRTSRSTS